jgi:hypothetical protein
MAGNTEILIKRSLTTGVPGSLQQGELAYSYASNTIFIGTPDGLGTVNVGGQFYTSQIDSSTDSATGSTLVKRDASGNASFNTIYGSLGTASGVTANTYGDTTHIPVITVASNGLVTSVTTSEISTTLNIAGDSGSNVLSLITDTLTITGGEGITSTVDGNEITLDVDTTVVRSNTAGANQTIDGDVNISGNLVVLGTQTTVDSTTVVINDPLLLLANNNTQDVLDIGTIGQYSPDGGTTILRTGIYRHAGDQQYYIFDGYDQDISANTVNPADASFHLATLHANVVSVLSQSNSFVAAEGAPDGSANAGFTFGESGWDTGLFSAGDGSVELWSNNNRALNIDPSTESISFGVYAGASNQGGDAVAIGYQAGQNDQGNSTVAVGQQAARNGQSSSAVAIGQDAAYNYQGTEAVAIGRDAGYNNQSNYAIAIGSQAGTGDSSSQGQYAVAIGYQAGWDHQQQNSIALNASGNQLNPDNSGFYVDPIREDNATGGKVTTYNTSTKELVSTNVQIDSNGLTLQNGTVISDSGGSGLFVDSLNSDATPTDVVFYNQSTKELTYGSLQDLNPDSLANSSFSVWLSGDDGSLNSNGNAINFNTGSLSLSTSGLLIDSVRYTAHQDATYDGLMFYNSSTNEVRYSYTLDGGSF